MKNISFQSIALGALLLLNTGILILLFTNRSHHHRSSGKHEHFSTQIHPSSCRGEKKSTHGAYGKKSFKNNHEVYRGKNGFLNPQLLKELNLTEEQQIKIKALREKQHTFMEKNKDESSNLKKELFQLTLNEKTDINQINIVVEKIGQHEKNLAMEQVKYFQSIQQILTPEQKQKVVEFRRQKNDE